MLMGKHGVENAYYFVSVFVPHQKLLKFANNNEILKLKPFPYGYKEILKCWKMENVLLTGWSDDVIRKTMIKTYVLFSV